MPEGLETTESAHPVVPCTPWYHLQFFQEAISINHAYWTKCYRKGRWCRAGQRKLTDEAEEYKDYILTGTKLQMPHEDVEALKTCVHIDSFVLYVGNFLLKYDDAYRKRDLNNLVKLTEDAVFEGLGVDDRLVGDARLHKVGARGDESPPRIIFCFVGYSQIPSLLDVYEEAIRHLVQLGLRRTIRLRGLRPCSPEVLPKWQE